MKNTKKSSRKNYLLKANLFFTLLLAAVNVAAFILSNGDKSYFTVANIYLSVFIGFLYYFYLSSMYKDKLTELKKEAAFINYPFYIAVLFVCIFLALLVSFITLYVVNKDALNVTFVFTFFMNMIFSVFPSILLLLFIYFMVPEFVLPSKTIKDVKNKNLINISKVLFALFLMICAYNGSRVLYGNMTIENREKFETARLSIHFSKKYLSFDEDINSYSKKKILNDNVNIPFLYTKTPMAFDEYDDARRFCESLGTRVANHTEAYYIAFGKFDTFGNKYYWTSDKDGDRPIVLHFKNMSYTLERLPKDTKPFVYCVADIDSIYGSGKQKYFYRDVKQEKESAVKEMLAKPFDANILNNITGSKKEGMKNSDTTDFGNIVAAEKKHVNFSVKEVPLAVFKQLLQEGYTYNQSVSIRRDYETSYDDIQTRINRDPNGKEIRLCYYPFTDYSEVSLYDEAQIYKQSFCSPAFEIIEMSPSPKTKHEKDAFCYSRGGRLPNIPELYGIITTFRTSAAGVKYWISAKVSDGGNDTSVPLIVYETNRGFIKIRPVYSDENETAFVYCVKNSKNPSKVIANYKSRFEGIDGSVYAKQKCPGCVYYEVPDVILQR